MLFSCWWVECTAYAPRHCAPPLQTTGLCSPSPSVPLPVPDRVEGCRLDPATGSRHARTRRIDGFGGWEAKAVRRADSQPRARRGRRHVGERRAWTPVAGSGSDAATKSEPVANTRFEWGRCEESDSIHALLDSIRFYYQSICVARIFIIIMRGATVKFNAQ